MKNTLSWICFNVQGKLFPNLEDNIIKPEYYAKNAKRLWSLFFCCFRNFQQNGLVIHDLCPPGGR